MSLGAHRAGGLQPCDCHAVLQGGDDPFSFHGIKLRGLLPPRHWTLRRGDLRRQVGDPDPASLCGIGRPAYFMQQLSHIARPAVGLKSVHPILGQFQLSPVEAIIVIEGVKDEVVDFLSTLP